MTLRIVEIFGPTIQGEGALIGEPTVFIRAGGCDYRCSWCDSMHAVDSSYRDTWTKMSSDDVWAKVEELSKGAPITVSISGGNPAIQDFASVIARGKALGYRFACETQGSIASPWFKDLDTLVLSPKPPSSGQKTDWVAFETCLQAAQNHPTLALKIVVFDDKDYAWAQKTASRYPDMPLYLQPGNPESDPEKAVPLQASIDRLNWLVEKTVADSWFRPRVLPQLHVLLWGNKRGV